MEPKWKMLKKAEMEDQPYSKLVTTKFQNVLILLPNKWNTEKSPQSLAHKTLIKVVMFKTYTETNIMVTTGYRTLLQQNMNLQLRNVLSDHIILSRKMISKLLLRDSHSTWSQINSIKMETRWPSLLIQQINMPQEPQVSITSIFLNGRERNTQILSSNGCGTPKKAVWNQLVFQEVLSSKDSTKTWLSTTGKVFTIKDSTTTLQPRNSKTNSLEMPWMYLETK